MSFSAIFSSSSERGSRSSGSGSGSGSRDSASSVSSIGSSILPRGLVDYIAAHTSHSTGPTVPFQIASDLHLEMEASESSPGGYESYTIPRTAPYLILAGDIGSLSQPGLYLRFLQRHCAIFDRVFLILGNHEFYNTSRRVGLETAQNFVFDPEIAGKLTLLNRTRFDVDDSLTILGCTLHSHVTDEQQDTVSRSLNDFNKIEGWTVDDHNAEHSIDIAWLRDQVEEISDTDPTRRILIITHHAPSYRKTSSPQHEDSPLNSGFCTGILEGGEWRGWKGKEMVKGWVFGHTHWCADFHLSGVRVVSNQRGYFFEQKVRSMYREELVLEI